MGSPEGLGFDPSKISTERKDVASVPNSSMLPEALTSARDQHIVHQWANALSLTYQPFDPDEEVHSLRNKSLGDPKQRVEEFKQNLTEQAKGIAQTLHVLEQTVDTNPRATREKLLGAVLEEAPKYRFSRKQLTSFAKGILSYEEQQRRIQPIQDLGWPPEELYRLTFGHTAQGSVEVQFGPATIEFVLDSHDYTTARRNSAGVIEANSSIGGVIQNGIPPEMAGAVIAINRDDTSTGNLADRIESTRNHERQHIFNSFFTPLEPYTTQHSRQSVQRSAEKNISDGDVLKDVALQTLRDERFKELIDYNALNEFLAQYRGGETAPDAAIQVFRYQFPEKVLTSSDYKNAIVRRVLSKVNEASEYLEKNPRSQLSQEIIVDPSESQFKDLPTITGAKDLEPYIQRIFTQEYGKMLHDATRAVVNLESKGYSREQIVSLLYQQPISRWEKLALRTPNQHAP